MSKEKAIEKIQYAAMQIASVYACSVIFDEQTNVIEGRQKPPYGEEVFVTSKMAPDNVFKNRRVECTTFP